MNEKNNCVTMENVLSELDGITAVMNLVVNGLGEECACLDDIATQAYLAKRVNAIYEPALYHIFDSLTGLRDRVAELVK